MLEKYEQFIENVQEVAGKVIFAELLYDDNPTEDFANRVEETHENFDRMKNLLLHMGCSIELELFQGHADLHVQENGFKCKSVCDYRNVTDKGRCLWHYCDIDIDDRAYARGGFLV